MRLIDQFHKEGVIDAYTFVFDEMDRGGNTTMLALSEDGYTFSNWTSGLYDPGGENEHLGKRVLLSAIGAAALNGLYARLSIPKGQEDFYATLDAIADEYEPGEASLLDRLDELRRQLNDGQEGSE
ncbi:MAG TPA: hypothetical protein VF808_06525 [Ktedonobacterales bacterium]